MHFDASTGLKVDLVAASFSFPASISYDAKCLTPPPVGLFAMHELQTIIMTHSDVSPVTLYQYVCVIAIRA